MDAPDDVLVAMLRRGELCSECDTPEIKPRDGSAS
jgi:hypothetical protein